MANFYVGNLVSAARQNYHYAWLIVGMAVVLQVAKRESRYRESRYNDDGIRAITI